MNSRVVVITGASAGIGAALARQVFAEKGKPVLVARRAEALAGVAAECGGARGPGPHRRVGEQRGARHHARALAAHEDLDDMMTVNVKSALYGMQAVLPHFKDRGAGHLINVSSMLGRVPFALPRAAYSASKHCLNSLTANFRQEVHATHPAIHVSLFSPGAVATDFGKDAPHGGVDSRALPNVQSAEEVAAGLMKLINDPRPDAYSREGFKQTVVDSFANL